VPKSRLRANRGQGRIKLKTKDFEVNVTTWPLQRKDVSGKQEPVPGIVVDWINFRADRNTK